MISICEQKFLKNIQLFKICIYLLFFSFSFPVLGQTFSFDHAIKGKIQTVKIYIVSNEQTDKNELSWEKYNNPYGKEVTVKSWNSGELYEKDSTTYDRSGNQIGKFKMHNNKRVDSTVWTYDAFGNVLTEIRNASYDVNAKTEYSYDDKGKLLTRKFFKKTPDGFVLEEEEQINSDGKIQIHTSYFDGKISTVSVKKINAKNNLVSKTYSIPEKKTKQKSIYKYDKKGRLILSTLLKEGKKTVQEKHSYREDCWGNMNLHLQEINNQTYQYFKIENYDSLQNLIASRIYDSEGISWEIFYEFDTNNRLVKKQKYDRNSELFMIETYKYDHQNNVTESSVYNFEKNKIMVQSYHYQYDEVGNWIHLKMYLNDEVFREYMQEIVYFD